LGIPLALRGKPGLEEASASFLQLLYGSSRDLLSRTTALACGGDKGVQSAIQCVRIRGATAHIEELLAISGPENRGGDFAWGAT
jgi:hypothetical protein